MGRLIRSGRQALCFCGSVRAGQCLHGEQTAIWNVIGRNRENRTLYFLIYERRAVPVFFVGLDDTAVKESTSKCFATAALRSGCLYFFRKRKKKQDNHFFTKPEDML